MTGGERALRLIGYRRDDAVAQPIEWSGQRWSRWAARVYGDAVLSQRRGLQRPPLSAPWHPPTKALIDEALARHRRLLAVALALLAWEHGWQAVAGSWGERAAKLDATVDDESDANELLDELRRYELAARMPES